MSQSSLPEMFHALVSGAIDDRGVYPHQAVVLRANGKTELLALDMPTPDCLRMLVSTSVARDTAELIYGFDRSTKPGQGTEFADCIAGAWFRRDLGWTPLVISYQHEPRLVRPIDWANTWWIGAITREMAQLGVVVAASPVPATAPLTPQPPTIDSAPRDGTPFLGYGCPRESTPDEREWRQTRWAFYGEGSPAKAAFDRGEGPSGAWEWREPQNHWASSWRPTHWMPLPAAPLV